MTSTRARFVFVALLVCIFAIGMATFLNYFKYKSTVGQIVKSRVLVVTNAIENSMQASLALGLSFGELNMLGGLLERQAASDNLILGIDVFDTVGKQLYSTDAVRTGQSVPTTWMETAGRAKVDWFVEEPDQFVAGIAIKNNFNLTTGYLAVRYSRSYVDAAAARVGKRLLFTAIPLLVAIALLAPLVLVLVIRRFETDMRSMASAVDGVIVTADGNVAFGDARSLNATLEEAEVGLVRVRSLLLRKT